MPLQKITFKHHYISKNYYKPAMLAIKCYTDGSGRSLSDAIDIARHFYTADPTSDHYIHPSKINRNHLVKEVIAWLASDAVPRH